MEPGLPRVSADPDRLQQVLANLLSNAHKFSPEGGRIRLEARRRGAYALVSVSDQGPGIPRHLLQQVLERYTQVRAPLKDNPLGTGLGLAISRELVERLGGKIWIESRPGEGTTVSFTVLLAEEVVGE
jgi:signal transduction histidine kinase